MRPGFYGFLIVVCALGYSVSPDNEARAQSALANGAAPNSPGRGARHSASDSTTPVPEGGNVINDIFTDPYFGIAYPLPKNWARKYTGPPPSDSGAYVLAELAPVEDKIRAHMEIFARDMFFTPLPAVDARQLMNYSANHLRRDVYQVEMKPRETTIAGHPFVAYSYWSPSTGLHWYIAATEIRCHALQFVLTSYDTRVLENLLKGLDQMQLPAEATPTGGRGGGAVPMCVKDYATPDSLIQRVDPVFPLRRFNSIPVRIIIAKDGRVKHIHILRAFPEQEKPIYDALKQWRFKSYEHDGMRVEVETGLLFGVPRQYMQTTATAAH